MMHPAVVGDQAAESVAKEGRGCEVNCIERPQSPRLEESCGPQNLVAEADKFNPTKDLLSPINKILAQGPNRSYDFSASKPTANQ